MAAYHVVWECVCIYELNSEYCNITLARTKLPVDDLTRSKYVGAF